MGAPFGVTLLMYPLAARACKSRSGLLLFVGRRSARRPRSGVRLSVTFPFMRMESPIADLAAEGLLAKESHQDIDELTRPRMVYMGAGAGRTLDLTGHVLSDSITQRLQ